MSKWLLTRASETCRILMIPQLPADMQHKFTSELKSVDCVEDDKCEFKINVEEDDAEVKWFKDGVEIIPDGKRYVTLTYAAICAPIVIFEDQQSHLIMKHCRTHHPP